MLRATPQRTAPTRVAPAPVTAPETTWVALTGSASWAAPWITTAAMVWAQKPSTGSESDHLHPECFRIGARRLDVEPESCVVIEDSPIGIQAGRAAGAR